MALELGIDPTPVLSALPVAYSLIFVIAFATVFLVVCYLSLLLICSNKWIELSVKSLPVLQVSAGVESTIIAVGGLLINPDHIVLQNYSPFLTPTHIYPLAITLLLVGVANMFRWLLNYWVQLLIVLLLFMSWTAIMLLALPFLHIRIAFWMAAANMVLSGFILTVMTMFTRNGSHG